MPTRDTTAAIIIKIKKLRKCLLAFSKPKFKKLPTVIE
jgi:hypothetical protein